MSKRITLVAIFGLALLLKLEAQTTQKPALHAKHWMAITGKPLAATAGASIFQQGGNAIDAACAMIAATSTMWDVLSWGGETQALIYNPHTGKVIGINALGVAPTGATPDFFLNKGMNYPPEYGPLAAVTPGTPGGICTMLAEYGTMSLKQVLAPAMTLASGYPIEKQTADGIERQKKRIKDWKYSKEIFLTHQGEEREAPYPGEIFKQLDLLATLQKMVDAEANALKMGKSRKEAIYAAYDRFYKGDIADEFVRGVKEEGGLITKEDLANWKVYIEEPVSTNYKGIEVYKLTHWVQSPVMLQALNMIEQIDIGCLEYNTAKYLHMLYQVMNMSFADRDFYYGDPYFLPVEPINGLLSKDYAKERVKQINWEKNDTKVAPGDPYPFQGGINPYMDLLKKWGSSVSDAKPMRPSGEFPDSSFYAGTTSVQAADEEGWVVSVTPSGGWIPAVVAGHTGVGLSQRMQSFVLKEEENPFNVVAPGKRPRATLTPTLALKDGKPYLSFAVQGGDSQDQNLLQFFLNVVEFGMNVQEAAEAANINSFQMRGSFGEHETRPGVMLIRDDTPPWTRKKLREMGYRLETDDRTSGPINAIYFDWKNGSMWGGSSNHGEDYGIGW
ncbi:MAG: gamma-glutamyltransferase [Saprospiraceae bacterium]|nr:gamma-glutamyltransferase [Saprospiraceae bacterium]HPG08889.1 gamma-glutamyltransferase [Saprospiraceae bacterium]